MLRPTTGPLSQTSQRFAIGAYSKTDGNLHTTTGLAPEIVIGMLQKEGASLRSLENPRNFAAAHEECGLLLVYPKGGHDGRPAPAGTDSGRVLQGTHRIGAGTPAPPGHGPDVVLPRGPPLSLHQAGYAYPVQRR